MLNIVPFCQVLWYVADLGLQLCALSLAKAAIRKTHRFRGFNSHCFLLTAHRWQLLFCFVLLVWRKGGDGRGKKAGRVRGWAEEGEWERGRWIDR